LRLYIIFQLSCFVKYILSQNTSWSRPDILIINEVGYFPFDELTVDRIEAI